MQRVPLQISEDLNIVSAQRASDPSINLHNRAAILILLGNYYSIKWILVTIVAIV